MPRQPIQRRPRPTGFTLTELMISVALALLLLVGINQVFKSTAQTVGTSYAALEGIRKQISINNVFDRDFEAAANLGNTGQPFILIHSEAQAQFWDPTEAAADRDGQVGTLDVDDNGNEGETSVVGERITTPADLRSTRNHRLDSISFFGRNINVPFRRQTGDQTSTGDTLMSDELSTEAYIQYGFMWLPRNPSSATATTPPAAGLYPAGDYFTLGQATPDINQNNFYAKDWALGRRATLLKTSPAGSHIRSSGAIYAPLAAGSSASDGSWTARESRFDIAATSIKTLHSTFSATSLSPDWHNRNNDPDETLDYRFSGKPWSNPLATDHAAEMALTTPFLARGVTQFIVEFAGDFITQNNDLNSPSFGTPIFPAKPDGIIDFMVFIDPATGNRVRRTRWYGFPRDVAGPVNTANPSGGADGTIHRDYDVVPVRDVAGAAQSFEKFQVGGAANGWGGTGNPNYLASGNLPAGAQYVCAWSAGDLKDTSGSTITTIGSTSTTAPTVPGPWLVRIILTLRDANNRLPDGTTIEHVYNLNR